jgi:hypothetical protein
MADTEKKVEEHEEGGEGNPEEEAKVEFKPVVTLPEVQTSTHEEDEEVLFKMYACTAY